MMVGGTWIEALEPIPASLPWLTNKTWCSLCEVSKTLQGFETILEDFKSHAKEFTAIYNSSDPY